MVKVVIDNKAFSPTFEPHRRSLKTESNLETLTAITIFEAVNI